VSPVSILRSVALIESRLAEPVAKPA